MQPTHFMFVTAAAGLVQDWVFLQAIEDACSGISKMAVTRYQDDRCVATLVSKQVCFLKCNCRLTYGERKRLTCPKLTFVLFFFVSFSRV